MRIRRSEFLWTLNTQRQNLRSARRECRCRGLVRSLERSRVRFWTDLKPVVEAAFAAYLDGTLCPSPRSRLRLRLRLLHALADELFDVRRAIANRLVQADDRQLKQLLAAPDHRHGGHVAKTEIVLADDHAGPKLLFDLHCCLRKGGNLSLACDQDARLFF